MALLLDKGGQGRTRADKGAMPGNNTPFSISLAKVAGGWKVSDMQQSDGSSTDWSGGLPGLGTPSAIPSPSGK
jgi:hypothetical protein